MMTALQLDYQRRANPLPVEGMILLLLSVGALALTSAYYYRLAMKLSEVEATQYKFERAATRGSGGIHREAREVTQEISRASEVLRQLSLPWENLFHAVESSGNRDVTLLAMEPDADKHIVRITCEARNVTAMLNYIKRLEQRREIGSVYLQNHRVQEQDPEKPVQFTLFAEWKAAP